MSLQVTEKSKPLPSMMAKPEAKWTSLARGREGLSSTTNWRWPGYRGSWFTLALRLPQSSGSGSKWGEKASRSDPGFIRHLPGGQQLRRHGGPGTKVTALAALELPVRPGVGTLEPERWTPPDSPGAQMQRTKPGSGHTTPPRRADVQWS